MDINLDTVKGEILEHLESQNFTVFRSSPGGLEGQTMVLWDSERFPDFRMFLEVAQRAGVQMVLFSSAEFVAAEIDDLLARLDECQLTREESLDYEGRLNDLRIYDGVTCSMELAFDMDGRLYVFDMQADWYEDFLAIDDDIHARLADAAGQGEEDTLGGYYSKN